MCSHSYPACSSHTPYCHLWLALLGIFFHISSQTQRFSKENFWTQNMCFNFPYRDCLNTHNSKKKWARYKKKKFLVVFVQSTRYSYPILMKIEFSPQCYKKYSNINFHENPSSGSRGVPCGQKDWQTGLQHRHDGANNRFSEFCENA